MYSKTSKKYLAINTCFTQNYLFLKKKTTKNNNILKKI